MPTLSTVPTLGPVPTLALGVVLGAALTHPDITTDYSEALMEFITPPLPTVGEALDKVTASTFSRIPLYNKHPGDLKMVLFTRDLLEAVAAGKHDTRLHDIAHEMLYVPQQQTIAELFQQLRRASRHMASVFRQRRGLRWSASSRGVPATGVRKLTGIDSTPSSRNSIAIRTTSSSRSPLRRSRQNR